MSSDGESGQMMLLAAIILIIAFLALSTMVARITIVEQETGREASPVVLDEAEVVARAIQLRPTWTAAQQDQLRTFEAERGYLLTMTCSGPDTVTLSDGRSSVAFPVVC